MTYNGSLRVRTDLLNIGTANGQGSSSVRAKENSYSFIWCDKNILKIGDVQCSCEGRGEEIRKFLLPISVVQYNKAFVGVRTTFLLVWNK